MTYRLFPKANRAPESAVTVKIGAEAYPFFAVSTSKFIKLSICTFGIYEAYWCYKNWVKLQESSREDLVPAWRAAFAPLWCFSLFGRIRDVAATRKISVWWSAGALGGIFLIMNSMVWLPDPWWWASLTTFLPMLPVQLTTQQINRASVAEGEKFDNGRLSVANIVTIVVGGLLLMLALIGTFLPE